MIAGTVRCTQRQFWSGLVMCGCGWKANCTSNREGKRKHHWHVLAVKRSQGCT